MGCWVYGRGWKGGGRWDFLTSLGGSFAESEYGGEVKVFAITPFSARRVNVNINRT